MHWQQFLDSIHKQIASGGAQPDLFHEFKASTVLEGAVSLARMEHE
jgi:hypothetical protein